MSTPGRNDPCPCGSGKKYKHCCMGKAAAVRPSQSAGQGAQGSLNRAIALHRAGDLAQAEQGYRETLLLNPKLAGAHMNLGLILEQRGAFEAAAQSYAAVVALSPGNADAHFNLANMWKKLGRLEEAVAGYRRALALNPNDAEAHFNLGNALRDDGDIDAAIQSYRKALALKPAYSEAHNNLGNVLLKQGKAETAVQHYREALRGGANNAEACNNMGNACRELGRVQDAEASYRQALAINPRYADAYGNLGNLYFTQGRLAQAEQAYQQALSFAPDLAEACCGLANVYLGMNRLADAVECNRRALALKPDFVEVYSNLGNALLYQGEMQQAQDAYRRALQLSPAFLRAQENLLSSLTYDLDSTPQRYLGEARKYGDTVAALARPCTQWQVKDIGAGAPLRVGLVSGDFRTHAVSFFLEGVLASWPGKRVQLIAYMAGMQQDDMTTRLRSYLAEWHEISAMRDEQAARKIHDDGIHILVDLSGHTAHNRLPLFAWKPAPVQASWLGYWASTGVAAIDYLLADPYLVPETAPLQFTERIWRLPETRMCFTPPADSATLPVASSPCLRNGHVTFGSFQNLGKINDRVLALWGRVLNALPDARLRLQSRQMNCPVSRQHLLERLAACGIEAWRVDVVAEVPRAEYLAMHAELDIILDTFPFPGGTTTCEALWMGVPTLTLAGATLVERQGAGMLAAAGLADWIARDEDAFVEKAQAFAADTATLAKLRAGLRDQVRVSPLFDSRRFAGNLEQALLDMWQERNIAMGQA